MSEQTVSYRPIREREIELAWSKFHTAYPWVAQPDWKGIWVRIVNGEVTGFVGLQRPFIVEPMWAADASAARDLMNWIDGQLAITNEYEFFIADANKELQKVVEGHFGLEGIVEVPGKHYFVKRG